MACSTLYGGYYKSLCHDTSWNQESGIGMSIATAELIMKTGLAMVGSEEVFQNSMRGDIKLTNTECCSFEVVDIIMPDKEMAEGFSRVKDVNGEPGNLRPLGTIRVRKWNNPADPDEDLTEEEASALANDNDTSTEDFWLEDKLLELCFLGLKFDAVIHELNLGIKYIDSITGVYCSFFTYLPNERMESWKEPVSNVRPAPMAGDQEISSDCGEDMD
jgi:hypothetical protein